MRVKSFASASFEIASPSGTFQTLGASDSRPKAQSIVTRLVELLKGSHNATSVEDPRLGATWWLNLSPQEALRFVSQLPKELIQKLITQHLVYLGPTTELVEVKSREGCGAAQEAQSMVANWPPIPILATIPGASAGKLVILDRFIQGANGNCAHGLVVQGVADEVIHRYAPQLSGNIVRAEVDFFSDMAASGKAMDAYIATFPVDNVRVALQKNAAALETLKRDPNNPQVVPLFYVQALLSYYLEASDTQVISASVWFKEDGYQLLPRDYQFSGSTMLTAAVSDDMEAVEEATEEPVVSFFNRKDSRTLLVGAYGSDGKPFGGYSKTGTGICCIGAGTGWTSTLACSTQGTSFSTPEVATFLFLARAFWKQSNAAVSSHEALLRIMLSSQIHPDWIGKYASAGPPQLPPLITTEKQYVIAPDLSVHGVVVDPALTVIWIREEGARFKHQVALSCGGDDGLCGLKVVSGQAFVFRDTKGEWERVVDIDLNLHLGSGQTVTSVNQFETLYEGIYSL